MVARMTFSSGTPLTLLMMKSTMPKGGVNVPIMRLSTMTTPKWIGSIPTDTSRGASTGTKNIHRGNRLHEAADHE